MTLNVVLIVCWLVVGVLNTINYLIYREKPTLTILWIAIVMIILLEIQVISFK
ncbi:hypothetical protein J18TS1_12050 [Oceanobacillus oncorhynchi subsp. incaldanensis]|nr:hypothetical protein J18TS1_12050 [Oceanobacillus oncorhynchi subsp. incaldanensis]